MRDPITLPLNVLDPFISISKELATLPVLVLPQYQPAARGLLEISQRLLAANENLARWLYEFLYFDFRQEQARTKFLGKVRDYRAMKTGEKFRELKFNCSNIYAVYDHQIKPKMGSAWFSKEAELEKAKGIFEALGNADEDMVTFTYDYVIGKLDSAVSRMEAHVEAGAMNDAEEVRLLFKAEMKEIMEHLERFSGDLSDLVILFAKIARVPVTFGST